MEKRKIQALSNKVESTGQGNLVRQGSGGVHFSKDKDTSVQDCELGALDKLAALLLRSARLSSLIFDKALSSSRDAVKPCNLETIRLKRDRDE